MAITVVNAAAATATASAAATATAMAILNYEFTVLPGACALWGGRGRRHDAGVGSRRSALRVIHEPQLTPAKRVPGPTGAWSFPASSSMTGVNCAVLICTCSWTVPGGLGTHKPRTQEASADRYETALFLLAASKQPGTFVRKGCQQFLR